MFGKIESPIFCFKSLQTILRYTHLLFLYHFKPNYCIIKSNLTEGVYFL